MTKRLLLSSITILLAGNGTARADTVRSEDMTPCQTLDGARHALAFPVSKDASARYRPGDPARSALPSAVRALKKCPTSEGTWYEILRARELLGCDPRRTLEFVERARQVLPRSVAIATLQARLLGTLSAAKAAVALAPGYVPAKLALVSALLDDGRIKEASAALTSGALARKAEASGLRARLRLSRHDYRGALDELGRGGRPILGTDVILSEPTAGLRWPWNDGQVHALAEAEVGDAQVGALQLTGTHVGTLPELRTAVAQRTTGALRLMAAMGRLLVDKQQSPEYIVAMAVALARLKFIAGQVDEAASLISATPQRKSHFCATLPEFTWVMSAGGTKPVPLIDKLQSLCIPWGPKAKSLSEPRECDLSP
jgi:hypothetical protein